MKYFIRLYRPRYVVGISPDGFIEYRLGDLRAKLLGIRIPVEWALDRVMA